MALSTYFNWDALNQTITNSPEMSNVIFHEPPDYHHLLPLHYQSEYYESYNSLHPNTLFDPNTSFLYPEHDILSYSEPFVSLPDVLQTDQDYSYNLVPCPKRQKNSKCYYENINTQDYSNSLDFVPSNFWFDGNNFAPNSCFLPLEELPEFAPTPPGHSDYCMGICEKKTVSPQSVAARERRRKITEKTQELGKLVPGGYKMNTAEMFHSAAKYVKFLQAQVCMLQLMDELQDEEGGKEKESNAAEEMKCLLACASIQEKLYVEEKCFVPKEFVTTLTNHEDVQSKPIILEDINQLAMGKDNETKLSKE